MTNQPHQRSTTPADPEFFTPAYLEQRRRALALLPGPEGVDELDPKTPAGHADAIRTSTRLTSYIKQNHRNAAMDITPQDVIDVLNAADIKQWVLMGLHGYVGYMPSPCATEVVDIMVPYTERKRAQKAITKKWPELVVRKLSQVVRFMDPSDFGSRGRAQAGRGSDVTLVTVSRINSQGVCGRRRAYRTSPPHSGSRTCFKICLDPFALS